MLRGQREAAARCHPLFASNLLARSQRSGPQRSLRRRPQRLSLRACACVRPAGLVVLDQIHRAACCEYRDRRVTFSASASGALQPQASSRKIAGLLVADLQVCGWEVGGGGAPALR